MKAEMKWIAALLALLMLALPAAADGDHGDTSEALGLIEQQVPCEDLTEEQFELLGDYYMELMHPGEEHETMDEMMGGEGSESLHLMHTRIGQRFYCGDAYGYGGFGMTGNSMMGGGFGMMGGGFGMMGSGWSLWSVLYIIFWIALIVVIILLAALLYKKLTEK